MWMEIRGRIHRECNLQSIFPANDRKIVKFDTNEFISRCMHERKEDCKESVADFIEDVVVKLRKFSDDEIGQKAKQDIQRLLEKYMKNASVFVHGRRRYVVHPGLSPLVSIKITDSTSILELFFAKHSLLSVSRFHSNTTLATGTISNSTGPGCKDLRLRFILYQLLQALHYLHEKGLCLDSLESNTIMLDDDMWLYVPIGVSERVLTCFRRGEVLKSTSDADGGSLELSRVSQASVPRPVDFYTPLTIQWISGRISNFEYLMAVNYGAGRTMMDPLYHPILPWVTDFSGNCLEGYESTFFRDLSMTKFRLSKGDTQLETTFKHSDPPHHIPESISELTYYIYMARRTPMQVLRRVVRDVFVPEHYPSSMARIYEWTPDECIPEFFVDPSVFQSVHTHVGLQDLELPEFAPTPEAFIQYHRAVLESDAVSASLHLWLDLTFGYCLQGEAAIKHMNVPLCHTLTSSERLGLDSPNVNKNPGFVMLFDRPHPKRQAHNPRMQSHVFSYDGRAGPSEDFLSLNPTQALNHSTKYETSPSAGSSAQSSVMKEYLSLDQPNRYVANLIKAGAKEHVGLLPMTANAAGSAGLNTNNAMDDASFANRNSKQRGGKRSLMQPTMEPSLSKLKFLENVDLRNDPAISAMVHNLHLQERHGKFAQRSGSNLDTVYSIDEILQELGEATPSFDDDKNDSDAADDTAGPQAIWDTELRELLRVVTSAMRATTASATENQHARCRNTPCHFAMEDMFFVGCMVAELYTGRSLLQKNDVVRIYQQGGSIKELISLVYCKTSNLPLVLRRLIVLLMHPDPAIRPRAKEILKTCRLASNDWYSSGSTGYFTNGQTKPKLTGSNDRRERLVEKFSRKPDFSPAQLLRIELLHDSCESLFPAYFRSVYDVISAVKMAPSRPGRLQALLNKLDAIYFLPLEGVNLALFFLIEVLSDSSYFNDPQFLDSSKPQLIHLASRYWTAIDVLGIRLGMEATDKLLATQVHKFISNFQNPELMPDLIESNIWSVIALRCGVKSFLRLFLPHLLTYVSSGVLQNILEKNQKVSVLNLETAPLWALPEWNNKPHWLRGVPVQVLRTLQQAAATSLVSLCDPDSLGKGITARYILPSLLSLVGNPQLAAAAFDLTAEGDDQRVRDTLMNHDLLVPRHATADQDLEPIDLTAMPLSTSPPVSSHLLTTTTTNTATSPRTPSTTSQPPAANSAEILESFFSEKARINTQEMYVVNAIVRSGMKLGEEVTAELILSHLMNVTLADLETQLNTSPKQGTSAAILEIIVMINGLLPALSAGTILHHLLLPSRISGSCIPKLLSHWPLTQAWAFLDDIEEYATADSSQIPAIIENIRLFSVFHEVCRLVVSIAMIIGPELCGEYILPSVDMFFRNFVEAYGGIHVESKMMMKAFEVGSELYLPLVQLMGAEAFHTGVPNVNPRLELWLNAIGSSTIPPKSPPLPGNIRPDTTSESNNQPEGRRRSIMSWLTGKVNSLTTANTAGPTNSSTMHTTSSTFSTPVPAQYHATTTTTTTTTNRSTFTESTKSMRKSSKTDVTLTQAQQEALYGSDSHSSKTPLRSSIHGHSHSNGTNTASQPIAIPATGSRSMLTTPAKNNTRGDLSAAYSATDGTELKAMETPSHIMPPRPSFTAASTTGRASASMPTPAPAIASTTAATTTSSTLQHVQIESPVDDSMMAAVLHHQQHDKSPLSARTDDGDGDGDGPDEVNTSVLVDHSPPIAGDAIHAEGAVEGDSEFEPDSDDEVGAAAPAAATSPRNAAALAAAKAKTAPAPAPAPVAKKPARRNSEGDEDEDDNNDGDEEEDADDDEDDDEEDEADGGDTPATADPVVDIEIDGGVEGATAAAAVHATAVDVTVEGVVLTGDAEVAAVVATTVGTAVAATPSTSYTDEIALLLPKSTTDGASAAGASLMEDDYVASLIAQSQQQGPSLSPVASEGSFSSFSTQPYSNNTNRKHAITDKRNPFLTYRKLMAGRTTKTARASQQALSAAMMLMKSPKPPRRTTKVSTLLGVDHSQESPEDAESREWYHNALVWLLAGQGRWNIDKEVSDRNNRELNKLLRSTPSYYPRTGGGHHGHDWNPAAQMSMTTPKIAVDVSNDAGSLIHFQLQANTQWRLEESPGFIRCMVSNPAETLLMTCSRSGVRIWSLTSHPLSFICNYTSHNTPPFQGAFVRDGQHAVTCDGAIHLWDIEYHHPLSMITNTDKSNGFSSFHMIPSKIGVHASIDGMGDEQLIATVQDSICYYDVRCSHQRSLYKVADWVLPPIPPQPGTLYNSAIEPLHLTCATSNEHYVYAGSLTGGIWVLDRRMGRVLHSWQAHDGPVLKLQTLNDRHLLAVTERGAAVWEYSADSTGYHAGSAGWGSSTGNSSHAYFMNPSCLAPPIAYPREFTGDSSQFHQREVPFHQVYRESRDPYTSASFYHMGLGSIGDFRKVYNVKCAGGDNPFSASNIIVSHFDSIGAHQVTSPGIIAAPMNSQYAALHHHYGQHNQLGNDVLGGGGGGGGGGGNNGPGSGNNGNGVGVPYGTIKYGVLERDAQSTSSALAASRACTGLYCLSAHRIHAGLLPNLDGVGSSSGSSKNPMNSIHKENYEGEDIRLAQNYFSDRKGAKLTKSKLQVTSALMLPLRRLLLIGTEDGLVRVVS